MKELWRKNRFTCCAWVVFAILFFVLCIYLCPRAVKLIDSDMSAELVLADILDRENAIITKSWFYSTEIKVFHTNILYTVLFKLLPTWHAVRVVSYPLLFAFVATGVFFFCKRMGHEGSFPFVASMLLLPFSDLYFRYALKGGYYLPYIIISFFALALTLHYTREENRKKSLWILAGSIALSFISGLNGPRQMLVLYLPLLMTVGLLLLAEMGGKKEAPAGIRDLWMTFTRRRLFLVSLAGFAGNAIGCVVNTRVLASSYRFASWNNLHFMPFDFDRVFLVLSGLLNNFGYVSAPMGGQSVVTNAVALCFFACTLFAVIMAFRYRKQVSDAYYFLAVFFVCNVIVFSLLYALTDMAYQDLYNLPLIVFAYPLIFMGLEEAGGLLQVRRTAAVFLAAMMTVASFTVYRTYSDVDQTADLRVIGSALREAGYEKGYATFWNANVLTELTGGAIEMWSWDSTTESGYGMQAITGIDQINPWLQKASHLTEKPTGKVFVLMTDGELNDCVFRHALHDGDVIIRSGAYTAYGYEYDTYEEMLNRLSRHEGFENMYERGVTDAGGNKVLSAEGDLFGPYMHFYQGICRVTVTGMGVDALNCTASYNVDESLFEEVRVTEKTENRLVIDITVPQDRENCSVLLHNTSEEDVLIDNIVIERAIP